MYDSHPAPQGLQVTIMEKQQFLYRLYTLLYFFRINPDAVGACSR